ncbi:amidohydrolase [Hoyosella rhizosphaerae]|uniref:5-methylthioadenosine/S-adenosylhomocysteine deaminase n=1 Tax=Hoyosella rhizosphaerae TaxID=1755582 RepID=A0A916U1F1_9ACTN|nr:amidohydrolase [Hoyosella rhizosphaerae]MBN4926732.1 amidohydrolase [Hoyosella rhizosphaerae]GGC56887.1 5-methylthioadenosine/S-adenosylhomocysteine deaminase [Hoyosella rhizosphaerae]
MNAPELSGEMIIRGGTILTMDDAATVWDDAAIHIRNGVIVDIGPSHTIKAHETGCRTVDAHGCAILPGFVNAHTHLAMTLFRGIADDVHLQDFLRRVVAEESETLSPQRVYTGALNACYESLLAGTTDALDMYWFPHEAVSAGRDAGLRVHAGEAFANFPTPEHTSVETKLDSLNAADRRVPWLMPHSVYALTEDQLSRIAASAQELGARIHVHAAENEGELATVRAQHGTTPIEVLHRTGLLSSRTVIAHAVHLTDNDISLIAEAGASVAHCPWSNLKLASGIAPVRALLDAGVRVCLGTDGAVSSNTLDMWTTMRLAAVLHKWRDHDPASIGSRAVLAMATRHGAEALGIPGGGVLAPGMPATLQIVDLSGPHHSGVGDIWSQLVYSTHPGDVRDVIISGVSVVADKKVVSEDVRRPALAQ